MGMQLTTLCTQSTNKNASSTTRLDREVAQSVYFTYDYELFYKHVSHICIISKIYIH